MKIKEIYEECVTKVKEKDPQYKKLAVLNYVILASLILLNLTINLLLLIPNDVTKTIFVICTVINNYVVNIIVTIVILINSIYQGIIAKNKHTIFSYLCFVLSLALTITLILLQ